MHFTMEKASSESQYDNNDDIARFERQTTPERPPYSPVSPVLSCLAPIPGGPTEVPPAIDDIDLEASSRTTNSTSVTFAYPAGIPEPANRQATTTHPQQHTSSHRPQQILPASSSYPPPNPVKPEPSPVPISESDNADAIALRSAISLLQFQKQKALKDIKALDELKRAAAADPERFSAEFLAGKLTSKEPQSFVDTDYEMNDVEDESETRDEGLDDETDKGTTGKFPTIPKPQNVVRMPPINWAKYKIVGEPLDKMHEEQRSRPLSGEAKQGPTQRAPEHFIASPYRALTDKIETPPKDRVKKDRKG